MLRVSAVGHCYECISDVETRNHYCTVLHASFIFCQDKDNFWRTSFITCLMDAATFIPPFKASNYGICWFRWIDRWTFNSASRSFAILRVVFAEEHARKRVSVGTDFYRNRTKNAPFATTILDNRKKYYNDNYNLALQSSHVVSN